MSDPSVIRISPPLSMDEIKDGPELCTIELIHLREPGEPFPSAEPWTANTIDYADGATRYPEPVHAELQSVVDYYAGHEFTGYLEIRNISPGQPPVSRYVMRDRLVVRLDPFIGWPPMQADDPSEDGLMDILCDPDAVVSVSGLVAGYATDVWETVPADNTDLPEKLLAWRDAAVQKRLANLGLDDEYGILRYQENSLQPNPIPAENAALAVDLRPEGVFGPGAVRPGRLMRRKATGWEEIPADVTPDDIMPGYSERKAAAAREAEN